MRKKLTSVAAISLIALALGAWSAPTSFAKMLPHIVASNGSAPVVMGTNFTPGGAVVLTEWQVRKQKPLVKFHISADGTRRVHPVRAMRRQQHRALPGQGCDDRPQEQQVVDVGVCIN